MEGLNLKQQEIYNSLIRSIDHLLDYPTEKMIIINKVDELINSMVTESKKKEAEAPAKPEPDYIRYSITLYDTKGNGQLMANYKSRRVAESQFDHLLNLIMENRENSNFELELTSTPYKNNEILDGMEVIRTARID